MEIKKKANKEWLENFSEDELSTYLEHLMELDTEGLTISISKTWPGVFGKKNKFRSQNQ